MSFRPTIDFGIHLGVSHAAVAVLNGTCTELIKNNYDGDRTPCAVYIDKRGQVHTGARAKDRLEDENSADDAYVEFKRRMGTAHKYVFKTANITMSPEQLSAEILKGLRGDIQQRLGEDITSAVITVPAAFEQKQCAATKAAGELAGLCQCPLVQEPVAAALAYGYQANVSKEYWLIFDFGGGTFDAAIMKAEDGTIAVVNHGGDNYLGGSDIDWATVEQVIIPELCKNHDFPDLKRGNPRWRTLLAVIKNAAEGAKIELSRSDTAYFDHRTIKDASETEIDLGDFKLTRELLVPLAEPLIMRAVEISQRVLKEKSLSPSAIEKVVLVGGPTLAPYFRDMLQGHLGIPLDFSVDPFTAVARGAAMFAGTLRNETIRAPEAVSPPRYRLDLKYKPVGADDNPTVRGAVSGPEGTNLTGFTIEFVNQQTHWRSGKVPLEENGRFRVDLRAAKGVQNRFAIELEDPRGASRFCTPHKLTYTVGLAISEQPVINTVALVVRSNVADPVLHKGDSLPTRSTRSYTLEQPMLKTDKVALSIPVVEGEEERGDRNRLLGKLVVPGSALRKSVPAGSLIEITFHMDQSRIIRAKVYIPAIDEEYEAVIDHNCVSPDAKRLRAEYCQEVERFEYLRGKANESSENSAVRLLDELDDKDAFGPIEALLESAPTDPDAANNAEKRLLDVKIALDRVERAIACFTH